VHERTCAFGNAALSCTTISPELILRVPTLPEKASHSLPDSETVDVAGCTR
jgi:hypothetical protein